MSARTFTVVCCDGCGEFYPTETLPDGTATETRRELRLDGWAVALPGGKDYCSDCRVVAVPTGQEDPEIDRG